MEPTLPTAMAYEIEGGDGARWVLKQTTCVVDLAELADATVKLQREMSHALDCSR